MLYTLNVHIVGGSCAVCLKCEHCGRSPVLYTLNVHLFQGEAGDREKGGGCEPVEGSVPVCTEKGRPPGGTAGAAAKTTT